LNRVAVALSVVIAAMCTRAVGETGLAPYGPMGQLVQLLLGAFTAAQPAANVIAASATGSAPQAVQATVALKVGRLVGTSPRPQIAGQLVGVAVGTLVAVPSYLLLTRAYGIGSAALPIPFAPPFKAFAEIAGAGIPDAARGLAAAALVAGVVLALLGQSPVKRFCPAPVAMGMGLLLPFTTAATIALGALLGWAIAWGRPVWSEENLAAGCAGVITGESLTGILVAALQVGGTL